MVGLIRSHADPFVFYRRQEDEVKIVVIYVDDGLICSNKTNTIFGILEHLKTHFEIRSLIASRFVSIDIICDPALSWLSISQAIHIKKLLKNFNMIECLPKSTPADPNARIDSIEPYKNGAGDKQNIPYREAVGGLMYIMVTSRPDIAYAVTQVAKFCNNLASAHWNTV